MKRLKLRLKTVFLAGCMALLTSIIPCAAQTRADSSSTQESSDSDGSELSQNSDFQSLLDGYIANDSQMQELTIKVSQAEISLEKTKLQNSTDVTLSSGDLTVKGSSSSATISASPSAVVSLPSVNNTSVKVTAPVSVVAGGSNSGNVSVSGTGASVSTNIISSADEELAVTLEKGERAILEAQRSLESRKASVEKEFLNELKTLYESYSKVLTLKDTLIEKQSSFETVKIQGYSTSSAKYRTSQLAVKSAERDVEEQNREFLRDLDSFGKKCGVSLTELPSDIPVDGLVSISDYDKSLYTTLEKSLWTNSINTESRAIDSSITLSGSAGYSYTEKSASSSGTTAETDVVTTSSTKQTYHNAEIGGELGINGLKLSAKVTVPVNKPESTSVTLSITWQKNTSKLNALNVQNDAYAEQLEQIDIQNAEETYNSEVEDREKKRSDLIWQKQQNDEQLSLYQELADDSEKWYKNGLMSETDYRAALADLESAQIKAKTTDIEWMIYNLEVKSLFYTE